MKKILLAYLFLLFPGLLQAQLNDSTETLLRRLDSVQRSASISRHFAELYFNTTVNALVYFADQEKEVQDFMQRLELRFAGYFLEAAAACRDKTGIPAAWKTYYADTGLSRLQYFLLGANAHINGDIWQAMTAEFSLPELSKFRKDYYRYNRKLKEELFFVYKTAFDTEPRVRLLHILSLGTDRQFIQWMLVRWRKRQMKLSLLWFRDKQRFSAKLARLERKMDQLNQMILRQLW